jgi:hypothetical protein
VQLYLFLHRPGLANRPYLLLTSCARLANAFSLPLRYAVPCNNKLCLAGITVCLNTLATGWSA